MDIKKLKKQTAALKAQFGLIVAGIYILVPASIYEAQYFFRDGNMLASLFFFINTVILIIFATGYNNTLEDRMEKSENKLKAATDKQAHDRVMKSFGIDTEKRAKKSD